MLRSFQTDDPATAWSRVQPELLKLDVQTRISGASIDQVLHFFCAGAKAKKDTLNWALSKGLLNAHREDLPTSYSLTETGKNWLPASGSER